MAAISLYDQVFRTFRRQSNRRKTRIVTTILGGPSVGAKLAAMASEDLALLKA
jgi:hypothetical protein